MKKAGDKFAVDLSALIDGELPATRRAEVEAHVAGCADCRQRVAELRRLVDGVAALPKVKPAPQFLADVRCKIAGGETPKEWTWADVFFRPLWLKLPLETLAAIAIVLSVMFHDHTLPRTADESASRFAMNNAASEPSAEPVLLPLAKAAEERHELEQNRPQPAAPLRRASEARGALQNAEPALKAESPRTSAVGGSVDLIKSKLADTDQMIISNDAGFLFSKTPAETIVTKTDDLEVLHRRLDEIARALSGFVSRASTNETGAAKLYVVLPEESVAAFKSRFAEVDKLVVGEKLFSDRRTPTEVVSNAVVVEIRVLPAKP